MVAQQRSGLKRPTGLLALAAFLAASCGRDPEPPATATEAEPEPPPVPAPIPPRDMDPRVYVCPDGARYTVLVDDEAALLLVVVYTP